MVIHVTSFIPYGKTVDGEHHIEGNMSVGEFVRSIGLSWDDDALVTVNEVIVTAREQVLNDGDQVVLLVPITGG